MTRFQKNNITDWVAALRSKKYLRCYGPLRRDERWGTSFDPFGVACEVNPKIIYNSSQRLYHYGQIPFTIAFVPEFVMRELYGLHYDEILFIMKMADEQRASFSVLADYIESLAF